MFSNHFEIFCVDIVVWFLISGFFLLGLAANENTQNRSLHLLLQPPPPMCERMPSRRDPVPAQPSGGATALPAREVHQKDVPRNSKEETRIGFWVQVPRRGRSGPAIHFANSRWQRDRSREPRWGHGARDCEWETAHSKRRRASGRRCVARRLGEEVGSWQGGLDYVASNQRWQVKRMEIFSLRGEMRSDLLEISVMSIFVLVAKYWLVHWSIFLLQNESSLVHGFIELTECLYRFFLPRIRFALLF